MAEDYDRRNADYLNHLLDTLCDRSGLPRAREATTPGLLLQEQDRLYRVVETLPTGDERTLFGADYQTPGELASCLQFASAVLRRQWEKSPCNTA